MTALAARSFTVNNFTTATTNTTGTRASGLTRLYLQRNSIAALSDYQFSELPDLTRLDLSHNLLTVIGRAVFAANDRLRYVLLRYNRIATFRFPLDRLPRLRDLDLTGNRLTTLEEYAFGTYLGDPDPDPATAAPLARSLALSGNDIECACSLYWVLNVARDGEHVTILTSANETCSDLHTNNVSLRCFFDYNRQLNNCPLINTNTCYES